MFIMLLELLSFWNFIMLSELLINAYYIIKEINPHIQECSSFKVYFCGGFSFYANTLYLLVGCGSVCRGIFLVGYQTTLAHCLQNNGGVSGCNLCRTWTMCGNNVFTSLLHSISSVRWGGKVLAMCWIQTSCAISRYEELLNWKILAFKWTCFCVIFM